MKRWTDKETKLVTKAAARIYRSQSTFTKEAERLQSLVSLEQRSDTAIEAKLTKILREIRETGVVAV